MSVIGVISDTHGLLRPEAGMALHGVEMILHAGDIGKPEILEELSKIAPVTAVRGNNDTGDWARNIPTFNALRSAAFPSTCSTISRSLTPPTKPSMRTS